MMVYKVVQFKNKRSRVIGTFKTLNGAINSKLKRPNSRFIKRSRK